MTPAGRRRVRRRTPGSGAVALLLACLSAAPAAAAEPAGFVERAEAVVAPYAEAGLFSGAVIVARDGRPLFRRAYGLANREWGIANAPDTRFRVGSITKQFTAAAILTLVERGRLGLDEPAARYVPDLPGSWAPITIRMLLDHSSGIPNVTALPGYAATLSRVERTPHALVALLFGEALLFPAGAGHEYSNTGYVLLADIVERVTGMSLPAYLDAAVLARIGMRDTGDGAPGPITARRASGYRHASGEWRNAAPIADAVPSGAGALASTVDDLVTWDRALFEGAVLSESSRAEMFRDEGHGYGLGWYLGTAFGERLWSHGGTINGFVAIKDSYPDAGVTIVVLANTETAPAQAISRGLGALVFGRGDPDQGVAVSATVLERYVGAYRLGDGAAVEVTREGERLFMQEGNGSRRALRTESDRTFRDAGTLLTFDIEPDGRPTGIMLHAGGRDRTGPRLGPPGRQADDLSSERQRR